MGQPITRGLILAYADRTSRARIGASAHGQALASVRRAEAKGSAGRTC
jgi:hypothetical protein